MRTKLIEELKKRLVEISHIQSAIALLSWDQEVYMPKNASEGRALSIAYLSGIVHKTFTCIDTDGLLTNLKKELDNNKLAEKDAVVVYETWRNFERAKKLPESFVKELAETASRSQQVWAQARKKNDFKLFLPWLTKIVDLKKREAEYIGYSDSPYDALLDQYEPNMTSKEVSQILGDLKNFLTPFIKKIKASPTKINSKAIKGKFPEKVQQEFNEMILKKIGFDFDSGRIDTTTHPFATGIHPQDVRITTRYKEDDLFQSLGSSIHEAGHGLYEQGFLAEHFGTPLAEAISLGIHESQSRMWENLIGKSKPFWKHFYRQLQKTFPKPFKKVSIDDFYAIINKVNPSLIRTESDEVTYNLHIILRYEIEKGMIEGSIELKDLPKIWNSKMKEYFGITVPNDSLGVLQDVHWSCGLIGYFPTYTLGNLYSAQFFSQIKKDIPNMEKQIAQGKFEEIKAWLRKNIHIHGKLYKAGELVKKVTGKELSSEFFIEYLKEKYLRIYNSNK